MTPTTSPSLQLESRTDDELLKLDSSSLGGADTPRQQDFGYEVIEQNDKEEKKKVDDLELNDDEDSKGLDVQYRGTPERIIPSKGKRGRNRHSQEATEQKVSFLS